MFVALEPAEDVRTALAGWRDRVVAERDDLRPVAPSALHVTLAFLGWQNEGDVAAIADSVQEGAGAAKAVRLAPQGVRPVPPRGPRLFALDLDDDAGRCGTLQAGVTDALAARRFYRPEKRPFWPHMTLARVKRGRRAGPLDPGELPAPFDAARVTLYRSTLRPQGAVYDPLSHVELGA